MKVYFTKGRKSDYLTPNKEYEIVKNNRVQYSPKEGIYTIVNDMDTYSVISIKDCAYLNGGKWIIKEE